MKTLEFKTPFTIGEEGIVKAEVTNLTFSRFVDVTREAVAARTGNQKIEVLMLRHRIMAQASFLTAGGKRLKLDAAAVVQLPPLVGRDIVNALYFEDEAPGKVLTGDEADGVSTAIHFQLGTPVKTANGKEIGDLEFLAKSYGDIEEIMAGDAEIYQSLDMLRTIARPAGGTMLALPSWAVDQISLADGLAIMRLVLPRFLR